jgi:hypothetical protein
MAIFQMHDGGLNPLLWSQNGSNPQGIPKCSQEDIVASHYTWPFKTVIKHVGQTNMGDGCECKDCTPVAVGDVITIGKIPAGQSLNQVQWDVISPDPTFKFDLEVRKDVDLTVAGTVIHAGLGTAVEDGADFTHTYFSKYAVPCPGKDCYGNATTAGGYDHAMIVMVVKALPTGGQGGCSLKCSPLGSLKFDLKYVVGDLR